MLKFLMNFSIGLFIGCQKVGLLMLSNLHGKKY